MEELQQTQKVLLHVTAELVSSCSYCIMISADPQSKTPIHCTKFSGSCNPIMVNVSSCLSCGEYKSGPTAENPETTETKTA
ncbi:hypothetical protein CF651_06705 [Paenibacillus rigui]|uniref:Uncharacterized protein n=1 Tax=Paenibacillus rigui TaxID=554312 RepID=A0A229UUW6_9BACL|nr:hypothetical protein CF651_06705 [Paenibacillus rigui]